jgi:hypothetical protein
VKIYLAGILQTGFTFGKESTSENVMVSDELRAAYPYDLESYHYIGDSQRVIDYLRSKGRTIFLDSGAFSMFTQGIKVDLKKYAQYIIDNADVIHVASNLDEIGAGKEQESYANQKALERMGAKIQPVHHARDDDYWLEKYIGEGYDYIFLGGMVPESAPYLRRWLDRIFDRYLTNPDGTAKIKVHGFGLTAIELMRRYPWYSVDSTSWVLAGRYGFVNVDLPTRDLKIAISDQSPSAKVLGSHYDSLDPVTQRLVRERLEALGYDIEKLRTMYGWRDHANVTYYERMMERPDPRFIKRDYELFEGF